MRSRVLYYANTEDGKIIVWGTQINDMTFNNVPEMLKFFGYDKYEYVYMNNYFKK